ncbi:MAG TPA: DUF2807 domain-containing protein [Allosphingosinicella sp.]|nr:DUF2807 domain-containing protein [Allosphingosinicella sp.]
MTRLTLALLTLAALAAPARAADRAIPVADFNRLIVEGPYRVELIVGRPTTAVASGSREGLDRVSIETTGQTLRIRPRRNLWGANAAADPGPVTIRLTTRVLRSARLLGPAVLDVGGARAGTAGLAIDFMVEGSGTLRVTGLDADALSLGLLGAGSLEVAGTARSVRGQFQGTGSVAAANLAADTATITTNTVGAVALRVNGRAEINAYGLGTVTIGGTPACVLSGPGAANVRCGGSDQGQAR